jgi:PAS domain S-box-containing protein
MDPDDARRRRLLNIILFGFAALVALSTLVAILALFSSGPKEDLIALLLTNIAFLIVIIIVFAINRYGSGALASSIFLVLLVILLAFADTPAEVAGGRTLFVFVIPIVLASVILQSYASFILAALSSLVISGLAVTINKIPNIPAIIGYFAIALVSWLASRSLEQALKDLREINLNLDRLVEQKTQELAATLSRELILAGRNQAILNSIADGVIVFDERNTSILANPALSQLTETPAHDLINKGITNFLQNESLSPATQGTLMGLLENPKKSATGMRIAWGSKTLSTSIARVHDGSDRHIGTVAVFRDVTREVELERMKDTFMGIVSHELRTPLNAILGYTEMFKEGVYGPLTEKQLSISGRVMNNTQRLLAIVSDLLDQAQVQSGKLKIQMIPCKPAEMLESLHGVMDKIAADKGLEFITELDPAMPPVMLGDPQRLQQIMVNLANNSVKFTEKGSVSVKMLRVDENSWQIQTVDTGGGIPKEAQQYIFESFRQVEGTSTRKHGGVGLGLSIVKQLVDLMKGKINVESELGMGSTFTATLPLVLESPTYPKIKPEEK